MNELIDGPVTVHLGDALPVLREMPSESVHCVVTSPPYWGLRDYGASGQLGLEARLEEYVAKLVEIFREVRRVLRREGTCWLNLGDSYSGLKPKDLAGIPWRVAFALQADGWWLRSDIVWSKPNPMPESVTDRPTKSHEFLFLLTKSERYFYDQEPVREPYAPIQGGVTSLAHPEDAKGLLGRSARGDGGLNGKKQHSPDGRNLRSVWTIATQPRSDAHFAAMPDEVARRAIAAGTSEHGVCGECGSPWERVVEAGGRYTDGGDVPSRTSRSTGWHPTCAHDRPSVPAIVLDPFLGSGTTAAVGRRMGRRSIGIELHTGYLPLIRKRVDQGALPLLEAAGLMMAGAGQPAAESAEAGEEEG